MSQVGKVCEDECALILLLLDVSNTVNIALNNTVSTNQCKIVVYFPKIIVERVLVLGSAFHLITGPYSDRPLSVIYTSHLQIFNLVKPL
jgi:hypothetical protein